MNLVFAQLLLETLMLGARNGAMNILPIQLAVKLILSHHQLDVNKLSTNLPILQMTHLLALILYFVTTWIYFQSKVLISHCLKIVIIILFLAKSTFEFSFPQAMFVKCGIIVVLMLKIYKKLFWILIGKRLLEIFQLKKMSVF